LEIICNGSQTYLYILSALYSIEQVGQITTGALLTRCVQNLIKGTKSKVPNIRFTAVKLLNKLSSRMSNEDQNASQNAVKSLLEEKNQDIDVKFFATQYLQKSG